MDDAMIDSLAGDPLLRRRLEAYAEARLTPDAATTTRLRAKVLAHAHRRAALARADAALTVVPEGGRDAALRGGSRARRGWPRALAMPVVAALGLAVIAGSALAARPGGPLYDARVWAEGELLPASPSARAVAELDRLTRRLEEAAEADAAGDRAAATAALAAYARIVDQASAEAVLAGDPVASAALETGVARNVTVLEALAARVPDGASVAIGAAIEQAIERSEVAVDAISDADPGRDGAGGGEGPNGAGNGGDWDLTEPSPQPTRSEPSKQPQVGPTKTAGPKPTATPRPDRSHDPGKPPAPKD
jgi:hypothetical protein